jgi:hypothetical protein
MLRTIIANLYRRLPLIRECREIQASLFRIEKSLKAGQLIRFLDFEMPDRPGYQDPRRLFRHHAQVCSQNGEDGIIHEIFRRIGASGRVFAEVGVGDGCENNTAFLVSQGWTGFWIDGCSNFLRALENRADLRGGCLKYLISIATRENVAGLFDRLGVPREFDLLSLDIDQNTYYVWEGLSGFRPRVVVVEYNSAIPSDIDWKGHYHPARTWDGTQNFGASLKAFEMLGRQLGYGLVGCECVGSNAFFVRNDLLSGKFAEPFTAENHYEPPRYWMAHRRCHPPAILDRTPRS